MIWWLVPSALATGVFAVVIAVVNKVSRKR
jgi:hypothetical protein